MIRIVIAASAIALFGCSPGATSLHVSPDTSVGVGNTVNRGLDGGTGDRGSDGSASDATGNIDANANVVHDGSSQYYPDAFDPNDSPPKIGQPGCGLAAAAFCDTFGGASTVNGRGGELDATFWSAGRMQAQQSTTRAMGIGMAVIPECRPGVANQVWPDSDSLICQPTLDVASGHLLVGVAAQNYGQNGYRIRQPFDFAGRTGKIVFDATAAPLSPLHGWVSLAITEDPIALPGYSIQHNDEGTIIPKNAVEVHFSNAPGSNNDAISVRNVHVFNHYVDTVYEPESIVSAPYKPGKLNHFEVLVSAQGIAVSVTPYSDDGASFAGTAFTYNVPATVPFSRGYVQLSVHNHATLKYTQPPAVPVDATVARIDNVGFDGIVIANWREYEVSNSLVKFTDDQLGDPYNTENVGYDIGYMVQDAAEGPKQTLHFQAVDNTNVARALLSFSMWVDFLAQGFPQTQFTFRARLNGKGWHERTLSAAEAAFFTDGPTTIDPHGAPIGDPGTQGRLALLLDVSPEDLVLGDNTVEFVTAHVPMSYPPVICNIDLVLQTN